MTLFKGSESASSTATMEPLLESQANIEVFERQGRKQRLSTYLLISNLMTATITTILWNVFTSPTHGLNDAYKAVSSYSPLFDKGIAMKLDESTRNDTLWGTDETTSIYIQDPSPEVDAAWDLISAESSSIVTISRAEALALGRNPETIVKSPEDWGMGDDAYPAQIDVFHEIHCLDMLRKEMYWDHYFRPQYGNPEDAHYLHVRHKRHCLRIVLRTIMCNADVNIVTHNWHRGTYRPIADFENPRTCRNFEGLLKWSQDHAVKDDHDKWRSIKRPADAAILPRPTPNLYISEESYNWINAV